jgi:hypothetical protein
LIPLPARAPGTCGKRGQTRGLRQWPISADGNAPGGSFCSGQALAGLGRSPFATWCCGILKREPLPLRCVCSSCSQNVVQAVKMARLGCSGQSFFLLQDAATELAFPCPVQHHAHRHECRCRRCCPSYLRAPPSELPHCELLSAPARALTGGNRWSLTCPVPRAALFSCAFQRAVDRLSSLI